MVGVKIQSVRINGLERLIENDEDLQNLADLIATVQKWGTIQKLARGEEPKHELLSLPLANATVGKEKMKDIAIRAAKTLGNPFTAIQLVEKMIAMGWETKIEDRRTQASFVRAEMKKNTHFSNPNTGQWVYQEEK